MIDMPTEEGSLAYKGNEPGVDATIVAIARHAGALIYGKTVCLISLLKRWARKTKRSVQLGFS